MGKMLDYIDTLNELDTDGVEPMSHVFPVHNVFREDVVTNGDGQMQIRLPMHRLAERPEHLKYQRQSDSFLNRKKRGARRHGYHEYDSR